MESAQDIQLPVWHATRIFTDTSLESSVVYKILKGESDKFDVTLYVHLLIKMDVRSTDRNGCCLKNIYHIFGYIFLIRNRLIFCYKVLTKW